MRKGVLRWLVVGTLIGIALGAVTGLVLSRFVQLPAVEALTTYRPSAATQVLADDGSVIATFANERRIPLPPEQIPQVFKDAVVAAEDADFYHHLGVDPRGMLRAALRNLFRLRWSQGASTLTQQLARTLFLTPEKKLVRKFKEMLLAVEIEQRFSKDQILTLYVNQVYFGHGVYGVEAASRFFFGKPAMQLTLPEAAMLAGIIQRNIQQSPLRHPDRALTRRNYVLKRMLEEHMIDEAAYKSALATPLDAKAHYDRNPTAAYFIEEVRRAVEDQYGTREILEGGLTVKTTVDPALQNDAENAVREGLVALQRRLGWPGARVNVLAEGKESIDHWTHDSWPFLHWTKGELAYALVENVTPREATLRIAHRTANLTSAGAEWTGRRTLTRLVRRGDVILVRLEDIPAASDKPVTVTLEPEPTMEGALVAVDNRTGAVLALVGGFDFDRSQWDRAVQAKRQCGSAFKPFVYTAAFERGFSPADTIFDGPVLLPDGSGEPAYCPLNYYRRYFGIVTLRYAVEHSLNASAVKLQQMVGGPAVIDVARSLGIKDELHPYATLALGSFELPLLDMTAAYAGLANRGQLADPYTIAEIRDSEGKVLSQHRLQVRQAVPEAAAYLMTSVLEGVVQRGTGQAASGLPAHLAGKTGTTDDYTDAWFIGYSPRITCGVWVGRDVKEPLGRGMTGAEAALPTWIRFMKSYLDGQSERLRQEDFPVPAGVVMVTADARSGLRSTPQCGNDDVILEAVPEGHEPGDCTPTQLAILSLPWEQQLSYYAYKPGEPPTTPEAMAAAVIKMAEKSSKRAANDR